MEAKKLIKEINTVKFIYKGELAINELTKTKIQSYWEIINKEKDFLRESNILIVSNFIKNNNDYLIELKKTTFSNYMYVKNQKNGDIRSLFSGAYILTQDQYIVAVMNRYYENELEFETLNLVGGMADAKDIVNGQYSSQKCLEREIKEELGFDINNNNWNIKLKYLKFPSNSENSINYPIGTIYEIKTLYTKEQLNMMFEKSLHDEEVKNLVFFSKENYKDIEKYEHKKPYMPELWKLIFEKYNWSLF